MKQYIHSFKLPLWIVCWLILNLSSTAQAADKKDLRFGVFPYLSSSLLEDIYAPLSLELGQALDKRVHFRTAPTFKKFFNRLDKQQYDIALIQPFWYPAAVDKFHYTLVARMEEPFTSLIMVLENSPIQQVSDLMGKVIATPPRFVPVVHMARKALNEHALVEGQDVFFKDYRSVDSCFQQLVLKTAVACVSPPFAPAVVEEKMKIKLRVLLKTPAIPNLSLLVHERVSQQDRDAIKQAFLGLSESEKGRSLLKLMKSKRFIQASDQEYDVVRELTRTIEIK